MRSAQKRYDTIRLKCFLGFSVSGKNGESTISGEFLVVGFLGMNYV